MGIDLSQLHDLARRYTAAWSSQDPANVAECYSAGGSLKVNDGAPAVGRKAIMGVAKGFMTDFPDMQLTMDDLLIQGDRAIYRWTLAGTYAGPRATGHRVRISGFEEWEMSANGLIAVSLGHFDEADYERQLKGLAAN